MKIMIADPKITFVKFTKGCEKTISKYNDIEYLSIIDPNDNNFYAQQAAIWRTESLKNVFEKSYQHNDRIVQETTSAKICRELNFVGLICYNGEPKRGQVHYDSYVYPHIATAVTKGKWNLSEYKEELTPLFTEYLIEPSRRGVR
jgi:hypothetical protein